jgi:methylmalonyl-CoA mutase, N-terminal domain
VFQVDPQLEVQQVQRVQQVRQVRDQGRWKATLDEIARAAKTTDNLVPPIIAAVETHATLGEIADALRQVFGEYQGVSTA